MNDLLSPKLKGKINFLCWGREGKGGNWGYIMKGLGIERLLKVFKSTKKILG